MKGLLALAGAIGLMTLPACAEEPATTTADQGPRSPSPSPTIAASPAEAPSPEEEEDNEEKEGGQDSTPKARPLDENAVLAMLKKYLSLYNRGNYGPATVHLSSDVDRQCLGGLADALAQNHQIEGINYDVTAVRAWDDEPNMADVVTIERYGGQSNRLELGLGFVFEDGGWKLNDLYPLGAGAFC